MSILTDELRDFLRPRRSPILWENADEAPLTKLVIDTMHSWLNGEPVWFRPEIHDKWGRDFTDVSSWDDMDAHRFAISRSREMFAARSVFTQEFGFAIPCGELIEVLHSVQPIVEVGAGTGYMTKLMRCAKIDAIGTDAFNPKKGPYGFKVGKHDPEQQHGVQAKTAVRQFRDRNVFCSWPSYNETWFRQALKAMQIGRTIIFISEGDGGCCADETAFEYLYECFEEINRINIPQFYGLHDHVQIHVKKRQRNRRE